MALAGRPWTIVEHMSQMPAAAPAMFLDADHAQRQVAIEGDRIGQRLREARPPGAAVIFGSRAEQRQIAAGTGENALALLLQQRAGEGPLGAGLAQDVITRGTEAAAPFGRAALDRELGLRLAAVEDGDARQRGACGDAHQGPAVAFDELHAVRPIAWQAECRLPRRHRFDARRLLSRTGR